MTDQNMIINIICGAGILNSLFLSLFLFRNKQSNLNSRLLGIIFIAITIKLGYLFIYYTHFKSKFLYILITKLAVVSYLSLGPLFLLYILSLKNHLFKLYPKHIALFIPSIIYITIPERTMDHYFWINGGFYYIQLYFLLFLIISSVEIFKFVKNNKHLKSNNLLSKWIVILFFSISIIWATVFFKRHNYFPELAAFFSFTLYILLFNFFGNYKSINKRIQHLKDEYCRYDVSETIDKITDLMVTNKPYFDSGFTISDMAVMLNIPAHVLSYILNNHYNQSFRELINSYRINEVQEKFKDTANIDTTIQCIAFDCGFNSLSVFNTEFKKATNITPKEFRNLYQKKFSDF